MPFSLLLCLYFESVVLSKGGKTKCDERKDDGNVGKELMERELGEIEGAEGCHNQM